jgi:hypothetical protein
VTVAGSAVTQHMKPATSARRNERLLVAFTALTNMADAITCVALPVPAVSLTSSPGLVALVGVPDSLPWPDVTLHVGALVDRTDRTAPRGHGGDHSPDLSRSRSGGRGGRPRIAAARLRDRVDPSSACSFAFARPSSDRIRILRRHQRSSRGSVLRVITAEALNDVDLRLER